MANDDTSASPPPDPVRCETCIYFRAFTEADRKARDRVRLHGDGWCLALPPQVAAHQDQLGIATLSPMHAPTFAGSLCRYWRTEFAGDPDYAHAVEAERGVAELRRIGNYLSELVTGQRAPDELA